MPRAQLEAALRRHSATAPGPWAILPSPGPRLHPQAHDDIFQTLFCQLPAPDFVQASFSAMHSWPSSSFDFAARLEARSFMTKSGGAPLEPPRGQQGPCRGQGKWHDVSRSRCQAPSLFGFRVKGRNAKYGRRLNFKVTLELASPRPF